MTEFERGISRALAIYLAGVRGDPMPTYPQVTKQDARALYNAGYEDALDEIASIKTDTAQAIR